MVFIRKENDEYSGRNISRDEVLKLRDLLRTLVPSHIHFTLHAIGYHQDISTPVYHIETIEENNCLVRIDSFIHHPNAYGNSESWQVFMETYGYIQFNQKPVEEVGRNPEGYMKYDEPIPRRIEKDDSEGED